MERLLNDAELIAGLGICVAENDRNGALNLLRSSEAGMLLEGSLHDAYIDLIMEGADYLADEPTELSA